MIVVFAVAAVSSRNKQFLLLLLLNLQQEATKKNVKNKHKVFEINQNDMFRNLNPN